MPSTEVIGKLANREVAVITFRDRHTKRLKYARTAGQAKVRQQVQRMNLKQSR